MHQWLDYFGVTMTCDESLCLFAICHVCQFAGYINFVRITIYILIWQHVDLLLRHANCNAIYKAVCQVEQIIRYGENQM